MARTARKASQTRGRGVIDLPKDDRADLLMFHIAKIKPLMVVHEEKKAIATAAAQAVTAEANAAAADLQVDKSWFLQRVEMSRQNQGDLLEQLVLDRWANGVQGFPDQIDAFGGSETPTAAKDANYYNAQGYQDGLAGNDSRPPEGMHSMFLGDYQDGWGNGQGALMQRLERAKALKKAQETPQTAAPVVINDDHEELDENEQLDEAAAKLKDSPFMQTGGEGAESETLAGDGQALEPTPGDDDDDDLEHQDETGLGDDSVTASAEAAEFQEDQPATLEQQATRADIRAQRETALKQVH